MKQEERLTHEYALGPKYQPRLGRSTTHWTSAGKTELMERLAAYEDTGLSPDEVKTLIALSRDLCDMIERKAGERRDA